MNKFLQTLIMETRLNRKLESEIWKFWNPVSFFFFALVKLEFSLFELHPFDLFEFRFETWR